jgi:hypothetical protein
MKRTAAFLAALATLTPASAGADHLSVARDQPLVEVSHSVEVRVDDGVARYKVRRTFANAGTRAEEASLRIDLAHGAAVTGLRIRARDRWFDGELMEAEAAREKYRELTGIGAWEPKDPALMQWVWADAVHLQVFPVLPAGVNTVEYTLTAPLGYRNGRYVLSYPRFEPDPESASLRLAEPVLRVVPGYGDARTLVRVAEQRVAPDTPIVLSPPPKLAWVGDGEPDANAGYAMSKIEVTRDDAVTEADINLEINHTFSGDLKVHLVTPAGEHLRVTDGSGGTNDIRGKFTVTLPEGSTAAGAWHLVVGDHAGLDVGTLDAWSLSLAPKKSGSAAILASAGDVPRFIPDAPDGDGAGGHAILEIAPPAIDTLDARLGRVVASSSTGFTRLELDAAPQLRPLPKRASVVFVLDVSRSLSEEELAAQLRIVQAYMTHVPDARAEIVAFDRAARRVFGEFVAQPDLAAAVARVAAEGKLKTGNGSALERGLQLAAEALHGRRGPARVVAVTDARLRTRFRNAMADQALTGAPQSSVTHLVIPEQSVEAAIRRDDAHALAPIASHNRGVLYFASAPDGDKSLNSQVLGLVRPISIDHFTVRGVDLKEADAADLPTDFREGTGYRAMLKVADPTRRVVISGKIWATPFRRVVEHTPHFDEATAAFVFSEDMHDDLTREEMLTVAFAGKAVSPVTSYLATEPGVRPSVDGLELVGTGRGGGGAGFGVSGFGLGGAGGPPPPPSFHALLSAAATACAARHPAPAGWRVGLAIETTGLEIVDVDVATSHDASPALRTCIVEAAWALELPYATWPARESHSVEFP